VSVLKALDVNHLGACEWSSGLGWPLQHTTVSHWVWLGMSPSRLRKVRLSIDAVLYADPGRDKLFHSKDDVLIEPLHPNERSGLAGSAERGDVGMLIIGWTMGIRMNVGAVVGARAPSASVQWMAPVTQVRMSIWTSA
jgi:hypothetical protein